MYADREKLGFNSERHWQIWEEWGRGMFFITSLSHPNLPNFFPFFDRLQRSESLLQNTWVKLIMFLQKVTHNCSWFSKPSIYSGILNCPLVPITIKPQWLSISKNARRLLELRNFKIVKLIGPISWLHLSIWRIIWCCGGRINHVFKDVSQE